MFCTRQLVLIAFLFFIYHESLSQKYYWGFRIQAHQSILKNIQASQELSPNGSAYYNSRERFAHPYLQFLASFYMLQSKRLCIGIEAGAYVNYFENFFDGKTTATFRFAIQPSTEYFLKEFKENSAIGVNIKGGVVFYKTNKSLFYFDNGFMLNGSFFYKNKSGNKIYLGIEKEFDKVNIYIPASGFFKEATGSYFLKRVSVCAGFAFNFQLKKNNGQKNK